MVNEITGIGKGSENLQPTKENKRYTQSGAQDPEIQLWCDTPAIKFLMPGLYF